MASLVTAGCFLVGNYEISDHIGSNETTDDDETDTSNAVNPDVDPTSATPPDADAAASSTDERLSGEVTTGVTVESASLTGSTTTAAPTTTEEEAATSTDATFTLEPTSTAPSSRASDTADAGVTSEPLTTATPTCPEDTTFEPSVELCVHDCGEEGVRGPLGRCYWVGGEDTHMPWSSVPDLCAERGDGWNVLTIRSAEEHTFVTGLLLEDTWLGARDIATPNTWVWVDDNTPFWQGNETGQAIEDQFVAWGTDEPSAANDESCARYHRSSSGTSWTWSDCSCGQEAGGGRGGGGMWGGPGDGDLYLPACKGPAAVEPSY